MPEMEKKAQPHNIIFQNKKHKKEIITVNFCLFFFYFLSFDSSLNGK